MRVDFHVHTSVSGAKNTPAEMAAVAKKQGLDAIAITDPGTLDGWKNFNPQSFMIIPGIEVAVAEGKVLVYGVKKVPEHDSAEALREWAKKNGYLVIPVLEGKLGEWAMSFDIVEAINANARPGACKQAVRRCTSVGKKFICASGANSVAQLGKFYTNVAVETEDWTDVVKAMKKGEFEARLKFPGIGDMIRSRL